MGLENKLKLIPNDETKQIFEQERRLSKQTFTKFDNEPDF